MPPTFSGNQLAGFAREVSEGLTGSPKSLPPKYLYDAVGSELFESITEQPEYYPTRTEAGILRECASKLGALLGEDVSVVELGSGSSTKTTILLESFLESQKGLHYVPIDISRTMLKETADRLDARYPEIGVTPIASQYETGLEKASALVTEDESVPDHMLVLFLGSSIGNMEPEEGIAFLKKVRQQLEPNDAVLVGFDLQKDVGVLEAAYNDAAGFTARFNLNILARINRELSGDFDLRTFTHEAFYNADAGRIEMHLRSGLGQAVSVSACERRFELEADETIHTESSYKYTRELIERCAGSAGFRVREIFTDEKEWFGLALFEPV